MGGEKSSSSTQNVADITTSIAPITTKATGAVTPSSTKDSKNSGNEDEEEEGFRYETTIIIVSFVVFGLGIMAIGAWIYVSYKRTLEEHEHLLLINDPLFDHSSEILIADIMAT